uniref:Large ribosomal subunit protein mL54 n=1 Tax=Mustela putorius furo TaxID=9669 RepID=M3XYH0_MUSPF
MAARRLIGATWTWTCWRTLELLVPAEPGRLLIRGYAKRPVMKGGKGGKGGVALRDSSEILSEWVGRCSPRTLQTVTRRQKTQGIPSSGLFQMNVGPPKKLEELDPETREYWRLLRKHNIWRHNRLSKNRKF